MSEFVARTKKVLQLDYDVSGGDTEFTGNENKLTHAGSGLNVFEIEIEGLDQSTGVLQLMDSENGHTFTDAVDIGNNPIQVTLDNTKQFCKVRVSGFIASYIAWRFISNTVTTGTIKTIRHLFV